MNSEAFVVVSARKKSIVRKSRMNFEFALLGHMEENFNTNTFIVSFDS